jgi:hypothetical protein
MGESAQCQPPSYISLDRYILLPSAAKSEFAAHGLAGDRIDRIAERAGGEQAPAVRLVLALMHAGYRYHSNYLLDI